MLMLDLDGFKHVNDTLGHAADDALLIDVSQRIEGAIDDGDLLARLERGEFELHYQPRWHAVDGTMAGVETLIRWRHRERGLLPPGEFVPLAEETGLIVPIGRWVLDEACRQTAAWRAAGVAVASVAVNVSAAQFSPELFESTVPGVLRRHGVAAADIELEITETVMMRQLEDAEADAIQALRARGLRLLLDDFGTNFSSLSYLQRFPLDGLKIDRSFVARLPHTRDPRSIVEAIAGLSRELSIVSIAEGVETEEQAAWLRRAGCDELQGFLYARPEAGGADRGTARGQRPAHRGRGELPARMSPRRRSPKRSSGWATRRQQRHVRRCTAPLH
jgi:EAL domain-containing protein (putative c-di-GMP-specific phosphodiesterase class I)